MSDRSPRPPGHPKPSKATDSHPRRSTHANSKRGGTPSKTNEVSEQKELAGEEDVFANTQRVRTGDKTLLLCMDIDESGAKPQPKERSIEISIPDILLAASGGSFDVSSIVGMELSLGFLSQSEDSMDKAMAGVSPDAAAKSAVGEPVKPVLIPSTLPSVPIKRRMSRAEQFSALEKTIPNVKLDRQMRKTVVNTMVEMNIWKDDDEDEDDLSLTESSPSKGRNNKAMANKSNKGNDSPRKKSTMISPATAAALSPNRKGSVKPVPPPVAKDIGHAASSSTSPTPVGTSTSSPSSHSASPHPTTTLSTATTTVTASHATAAATTSPTKHAASTASTLTAPTATAAAAARGKVAMHRPNQIPVNEQAQKRDDRQRVERESVRETLVNKAVQFLVDLNHKQDLELQQLQQQQQQQQSIQQHGSPTAMGALANKTPKEIKMIAVKKLTASLVDRALKRGRNFFHKEVEKRRIDDWKYFRRRAQAARFLSKAWRRHCCRHDVQKILAMGRASIEAKKVAEIEEQYEYRIRMAQRRVWEQTLHKAWIQEQREYPTFPVTKQVTEREVGPIRLNDDGLAMSSADEKLFAEDFNHLRPDLAPFSTKINAMISSSLQEVKRHVERKQLLERSMELFAGDQWQQGTQKSATRSRVSSMSGDESKDPATSSALSSPRATSTPLQLRSPRTPKTPNGTTMSASSRAFDFPPSALTLSFPTSIPMVAQTPRAALHKMRAEDAGHEVMVQLSLPQRVLDRSESSRRSANLAGWEEMARLDNLPSVEEIKKNAAIKSSAYKVLERLSGLTEEDIMRSKFERLKEGAEQVSLANSKFLFL